VGKDSLELGAGADSELEEHLPQVVLDRPRADEELGADLGIRESVARKPSDLGLFDDGKISDEWAADDLATFASQLDAVVLPWAS
jgi:hypothetical protein